MRKLLFIFLLSLHSMPFAAPMEAFEFDTPEQEAAFHKLSQELRCLVCQNQAIAESDAGLAKDLRTEIHKMLQEGKTEDEIAEFMVQRYGDYVLYNPPFKPATWLLWFGPALVFLLAVFYVVKYLRRQDTEVDVDEFSADDIERLKNLQAESGGLSGSESALKEDNK